MAISALYALNLSPVEKVKLGKEHGVEQWLTEGYSALIGDSQQAGLQELAVLGWETAFRIVWARNELFRPHVPQADGYWVDAQDLVCAWCRIQREVNVVWDPSSKKCFFCGTVYRADYYNIQFGKHPSTLKLAHAGSGTISLKVDEVFKEELEDAKRRHASSFT